MTNDMLNIKVIMGSTRKGRFSEKPAAWIFEEVRKRGGVNAELLDLRDYPMPFFDEPMSPAMIQEPYENEVVKRWTGKIAEADGFIVIAPEYNHGYPAVLKNAFDYVYKEWGMKPVTYVAYGSSGGARSVEQLRQVAVELQMAPLRNAIHIPGEKVFPVIMGQADAGELFSGLAKPADTLIEELLLWARVLKDARNK